MLERSYSNSVRNRNELFDSRGFVFFLPVENGRGHKAAFRMLRVMGIVPFVAPPQAKQQSWL